MYNWITSPCWNELEVPSTDYVQCILTSVGLSQILLHVYPNQFALYDQVWDNKGTSIIKQMLFTKLLDSNWIPGKCVWTL